MASGGLIFLPTRRTGFCLPHLARNLLNAASKLNVQKETRGPTFPQPVQFGVLDELGSHDRLNPHITHRREARGLGAGGKATWEKSQGLLRHHLRRHQRNAEKNSFSPVLDPVLLQTFAPAALISWHVQSQAETGPVQANQNRPKAPLKQWISRLLAFILRKGHQLPHIMYRSLADISAHGACLSLACIPVPIGCGIDHIPGYKAMLLPNC